MLILWYVVLLGKWPELPSWACTSRRPWMLCENYLVQDFCFYLFIFCIKRSRVRDRRDSKQEIRQKKDRVELPLIALIAEATLQVCWLAELKAGVLGRGDGVAIAIKVLTGEDSRADSHFSVILVKNDRQGQKLGVNVQKIECAYSCKGKQASD